MANKTNLIIFSLVVMLGIAGLVFYGKDSDPGQHTSDINELLNADKQGNTLDPKEIAIPGDPPPGYVKYVNEKYKFSYWHSRESTIKEYDEGGGATTIVQENLQRKRGLQIFIVPYAEDEITEERFRLDVPSGIMENLATTTVGALKIPAITFNSRDEFLGDTREVWFIYDGHLYEITTFRGLADWFTPLMQSWRFINT